MIMIVIVINDEKRDGREWKEGSRSCVRVQHLQRIYIAKQITSGFCMRANSQQTDCKKREWNHDFMTRVLMHETQHMCLRVFLLSQCVDVIC